MLEMMQSLEPRRLFAALPTGFNEHVLTQNLTSPTAMDVAPDGRVFICEEDGTVQIVKNDQLLADPFIALRNVDFSGERGLMGVTFDPAFASNNYVYLYYTVKTSTGSNNRASRFTANGDVAAPGETVLIETENLGSSGFHNGGGMAFGPDGKLYITSGENNSGPKAQQTDTLLGKILRINPDGSIPTDNPFYNTLDGRNRAIWALGVRNPFKINFQNGTGKVFFNDVGADTWEEIDQGKAGANYGWPDVEGIGADPRFTNPLFESGHGDGPTVGEAITGGTFYDPRIQNFPAEYRDKYFFSDLTSGWIRQFDSATGKVNGFAAGITFPVDLRVDGNGSLYYLGRAHDAAPAQLVRVRFGDVPIDQLPQPSIRTPLEGKLYRGGMQVTFSGSAIDAEDGKLKASSIAWEIQYHHGDKIDTLKTVIGKAQGAFVAPAAGSGSPDSFYRIVLKATDSQGLTQTTVRDLHPQVSKISLASNVPGAQFLIDGQLVTGPADSVIGMKRKIETVRQQTIDGVTYRFARWSDGGGLAHNILVGPKDRTLTLKLIATSA